MNLRVAISTVADGNMAMNQDLTNRDLVVKNRSTFLAANGIKLQDTTRVKIVYQGNNYRRYLEIGDHQKGQGMTGSDGSAADGLITRRPGLALFLPLADCVGTAIYDPDQQILMLSHLGRHSLEQNGGMASVRFLVDHYGCDPSKLLVWLTPAPGRANYPLFAFDNRAFKDVVVEQLQSTGIATKHITDQASDTTQDERYFSHSQFLKGQQTGDGRYAIVAVMTGKARG